MNVFRVASPEFSHSAGQRCNQLKPGCNDDASVNLLAYVSEPVRSVTVMRPEMPASEIRFPVNKQAAGIILSDLDHIQQTHWPV
jgi:hypothetical protein